MTRQEVDGYSYHPQQHKYDVQNVAYLQKLVFPFAVRIVVDALVYNHIGLSGSGLEII